MSSPEFESRSPKGTMASMELGLQVLRIHPCNSASPKINLESQCLFWKEGGSRILRQQLWARKTELQVEHRPNLLIPGVNLSVSSVQFSQSVVSTVCDPMDYSTPGFPVPHQPPEIPQTHVHQLGDAIQPSHPLLPPSPPAFNLYQPQGLSQCVGSSR